MATVPSYFEDFLSNIRLSENQVSDLKKGHRTLRTRLDQDEDLSKIIISTFLQGSYKRSTAVKPKNGDKSDVDIIVVTNLDADEYSPEEALSVFIPFLEKYYKGKYIMQGRSIGIELSYVDMDLVPTSAPSESGTEVLKNYAVISECSITELESNQTDKRLRMAYEAFCKAEEPQWQTEPLLIPDREADKWDKTHPLEQIRWTKEKNSNCNSHYINVVKAIKWWWKTNHSDLKHPKSYPLEHFIGNCCPDGIESVAEGIVKSLETIVNDYPTKPFLADRGVPEHDVFGRISDEEYDTFYAAVCDAATTARKAFDAEKIYDSVSLWRELFGSEFPPASEPNESNPSFGYTRRIEKTTDIPKGRFA